MTAKLQIIEVTNIERATHPVYQKNSSQENKYPKRDVRRKNFPWDMSF